MDSTAPEELVAFIDGLTGCDRTAVQSFVSEISSDSRFLKQLTDRRNSAVARGHGSWGWGISATLGIALYAICRIQRPQTVVETGVSAGVSSSYILRALEENQGGELYSIDLQERSGWLIPDQLRPRWKFVRGEIRTRLPALLDQVGQLDVFFHDSEHTYQNMRWEYQMSWGHLKSGGLLLSHNVDFNNAFPDFCKKVAVIGYYLEDMGGATKTA
jgi:predicted O-methyltransferase YrrM